MTDPIRHAPGIYLNLPFEEYLADDALGSSALKDLLASPPEYWWTSPLNTLIEEDEEDTKKEAPYLILGKALHALVMEGEDEYARRTVIRPQTYPDKKTGLPKKWNGNATWCKDWIEANDTPDRYIITKAMDARIRLLHRMMMRSPQDVKVAEGEQVSIADALSTGLAEVSIFYEEDGLRRRARLDRVLPNITLDLKSIAGWRRGDFKQSLLREAVIRGYVLQAVDYNHARQHMRELHAKGLVFGGTPEQREMLAEICEATEWRWGWIYAKTTGAPQVKCITPPIPNGQFDKAERQREQALTQYHYFKSFFTDEPGNMWFDPEIVWEPSEQDWPTWSVLPEA